PDRQCTPKRSSLDAVPRGGGRTLSSNGGIRQGSVRAWAIPRRGRIAMAMDSERLHQWTPVGAARIFVPVRISRKCHGERAARLALPIFLRFRNCPTLPRAAAPYGSDAAAD